MTGAEWSDEEAERAWRGGQRRGFEVLFRRHYRGVVAYTARLVGDVSSAEDVAQQAFMNVLQRRGGRGRFKSLIYTVARNLALNEQRRRGRRYTASQGLENTPEPTTGGAPPWRELVQREERDAFAQALEQLGEEEREALLLKETRGLTYAEVGQIMGLHPDAVRRRVAKAFARLRELLAGSDSEEASS